MRNFGVNLTELAPGAASALHHAHSRQDEFIFVLEGQLVLVTGDGEETALQPGDCAGFAAGGPPHHLENRGTEAACFLEVGDRTEGDDVSYPTDDLAAVKTEAGWRFSHKDGRPY
nr:cupin domain-containing protein [Pseudoroseomonas coralli]